MSAVRRRKISAKYRKIVGRSWGTGIELKFRRAPLTFTQQEAKLDHPEKIAIGPIVAPMRAGVAALQHPGVTERVMTHVEWIVHRISDNYVVEQVNADDF